MDELTRYEIWYGRDCPPPDVTEMRAGPLSLEFESGDLRYIRLGETELIRRVYVGIRDHNWNTIPGELTDMQIDASNDGFRITFDAHHRSGSLNFDWTATIQGKSDGTVSYAMDGVARSDFRYCRMGFCVLHPIRECAGRRYRAMTPDGPTAGELPLLIGPQLMQGEFEAPLFPACSSLAIVLRGGLEVNAGFEGDLFEMEDQRNWTDGSFKTYCTPLALGYPHHASEGERFHQKVTLRMAVPESRARAASGTRDGEPVRLAIGGSSGTVLPRLGFGLATHGQLLNGRERQLLSALRPAHLKAAVHLGKPEATWRSEFQGAAAEARQLGTRLELALFLSDDGGRGLDVLRSMLSQVPLARLIVFHESEAAAAATSPCWVEVVRAALGSADSAVPIGGGTSGNFAELNRGYPDTSNMDGISYTINPQVHASDERSLIEALEPQATTIETARAHLGSIPVWVSSVTLKPPFNQAATEKQVDDPNDLPSAVDPRQMSLFAAAWTVGSLSSLTAGRADSVTYFETTGWRGLIETEQGSPMPDRFRSRPGMVFPIYHVFADLSEVAVREASSLRTSHPLRCQGIVLRHDTGWRMLVANLLCSAQQVVIRALPVDDGGTATIRRLNDDTARAAMLEPLRFRDEAARRSQQRVSGRQIELKLKPYETATLDFGD